MRDESKEREEGKKERKRTMTGLSITATPINQQVGTQAARQLKKLTAEGGGRRREGREEGTTSKKQLKGK